MIRVLREFRVLPLVLIAAVALLTLKSAGLLLDGGYLLAPHLEDVRSGPIVEIGDPNDIVGSIAAPQPTLPDAPAVTAPVIAAPPRAAGAAHRQSWAQEMFNFPDITGSVGEKKDTATGAVPAGAPTVRNESAAAAQVRTAAKSVPDRHLTSPDQRAISPSERAILERLQERRKDLETRARELDMRETLVKAAEKQLEGRVTELKEIEERIKVVDVRKDDESAARFKSLIAMYENMKAKDAARIFDRLELKILVEVASQINPRRMSDILSNMSSEAAERLTIAFASRGGPPRAPSPADLPKIEGRPTP